jgi:hypothetical protein
LGTWKSLQCQDLLLKSVNILKIHFLIRIFRFQHKDQIQNVGLSAMTALLIKCVVMSQNFVRMYCFRLQYFHLSSWYDLPACNATALLIKSPYKGLSPGTIKIIIRLTSVGQSQMRPAGQISRHFNTKSRRSYDLIGRVPKWSVSGCVCNIYRYKQNKYYSKYS